MKSMHGFGRGGGDGIAAEGGNGDAFESGRRPPAWPTVRPMGLPLPRPLALVMMSGRHAPLLDAEPLAAGAAPAGLHFVADEDAAVIAHDLVDDLEIFLGRRDEAADALNGLGDEAGDPAAGGGADQFLHVLRAAHFAIGIGQAEGTAVAVGVVRVHDAGLRADRQAPGALPGERHRQRGAAVIGVAQRDDLVRCRCSSARPGWRSRWLPCRCW